VSHANHTRIGREIVKGWGRKLPVATVSPEGKVITPMAGLIRSMNTEHELLAVACHIAELAAECQRELTKTRRAMEKLLKLVDARNKEVAS
jgi:hypothetical protein